MFAVGLYDFTGTGDQNELLFRKDDVIELLDTQGDWLKAKLENKIGIVPRNYIKILDDVKPKVAIPQHQMPQLPNEANQLMNASPFADYGIDANLLQQFVLSTGNLNENQPIPAGIMNTYPLVKEQYGRLNEKITDLQAEQNKLLELHSKVVHANQLYDQLMEYQMISKLNLS